MSLDELNSMRLKMSEYGTVLVSRDQGEPLCARLMELLSTHDRVEVDLDDVEAFTPSFMDEVLGKCLARVGRETFRRQVKLIAKSQEVRKLVNLVLSNRTSGRTLD